MFLFAQVEPSLINQVVQTVVGFILTAVVGAALTVFWNLRQKRREIDILLSQDFFYLYGEFFAVWKLWNYAVGDTDIESIPNTYQWDLLQRITAAESKVEAILMKLATERNLNKKLLNKLGHFRQLYQKLREVIRDKEALNWNSSENTDYQNFKRLACEIATLIQTHDQFLLGRQSRQRVESWLTITSNRYEFWIDTKKDKDSN